MRPTTPTPFEPTLVRFLRTGSLPWPCLDAAQGRRLLAEVDLHRLTPLLQRAVAAGAAPGWPEQARAALAERARREAVADLRRGHELAGVLAALAHAGVETLLLKGAALAHTVYDSPELRPRCDADLLVAETQVAAAEATLAKLGYARGARIRGRRVEYQAPWVRDDVAGLRCVIDLHWRVSNRQSLAPRFPFESLRARAEACPTLGEGARVLDRVDALQVCAVHGPAHHGGQFQPLIWRYDLHLLARDLLPRERAALVARSRRRRIARLVAAALADAAARFGTPWPEALAAAAAQREPSAVLLRREGRWLTLHDLRHLPHARARVEWLREAALPDTDYLRWRYAAGPEVSRPRLLARRAADVAVRALGLGRAPPADPRVPLEPAP